jgi:hypothetical protein
LENEARASLEVLAPTVQALGSEAGEVLAALLLALPAATARKTLLSTMDLAALLREEEKPPPRDMLAKAPLGQLRVRASLTT